MTNYYYKLVVWYYDKNNEYKSSVFRCATLKRVREIKNKLDNKKTFREEFGCKFDKTSCIMTIPFD